MSLKWLDRLPLQHGLILFVMIGYLIQNVLIYLAFSQVPQQFLPHSYLVSTLQGNMYLLPTYVVLLIGVILSGSVAGRRALTRRYALAVIVPGLFCTALAQDAGHAFIGLIGLAFLIQWTVLLIGAVNFWMLFRHRHRDTVL